MSGSLSFVDDPEDPTSGTSTGHSIFRPNTSFVDLPIEVILKIFDYLEPLFLHRVISRLCKKFNVMLFHEYLWKRTFLMKNKLSPTVKYPYLEQIGIYSSKWKTGKDISWRDLCVSVDRSRERWFNGGKIAHFPSEDVTVSVVHVMKGGLCITGSRERSIKVWDLAGAREASYACNTHNGWVTGISTIHNNVVSCSWDSYVKLWSFEEGLVPLSAYCLDMAVMAVTCEPSMIAACTFPELVIIDPRIGRYDGLCRFPMEEGSLVQVEFWQNSIVLASRNKNLIQFDLRMGRNVIGKSIQTVATPRTMSILDDIAYVGDNAGKVYLFDLHDNFRKIDEFKMNEKKVQIRLLIPKKGYMIVGSSDGVLKTVLTLDGQDEIFLASRSFEGEITTGHYRDDILAVVNDTSGVTVFLP